MDMNGYFLDFDKLTKGLALLKAIQDSYDNNKAFYIMSGFVDDYVRNYDFYGVSQVQRYISDNVLREIELKNPIISACVNLRVRQIRAFSSFSEDVSKPGFRIKYVGSKNIDQKIEKEIKLLVNFFENAGFMNLEDIETAGDSLHDVFVMMVRDYMVLDKVVLELLYNKSNYVIDFRILDPATIKPVIIGGYQGNYSDFYNNSAFYYFNSSFLKRILESKINRLPPLEKIRYVQEIDGNIVAGFEKRDIIYDIMNKRTDIRYRYIPYSPVEQCVSVITGFLNALAYNAESFDSNAIPKIAMSIEGEFDQEQYERLRDQWIANFTGIKNQWKIPIISGKVNVIDLMKSPRDLEFGKYMEITGALICSVMGVDPAEIGLRLNQAQNVLSENLEAKMKFSKDRGLHDLLGQIQSVMNKILKYSGLLNKFKFEFTGLDPEDEQVRSRLRTEAVKRDKTINEIRAEQKLPPLPYGDVILDSIYLQYYNVKKQEEANQEQNQDMPDNEVLEQINEQSTNDNSNENYDLESLLDDENLTNDVLKEIEQEYNSIKKALNGRKIRTLLLH